MEKKKFKECDFCEMDCSEGIYNFAIVDVKDLHEELQEQLKEKDYKESFVRMCLNCRSMDAKTKLGTDNFSRGVIAQVELGLFVEGAGTPIGGIF